MHRNDQTMYLIIEVKTMETENNQKSYLERKK